MKSIIVASGKGGVGKSTVSYLLARCLSQRFRVLLLDFDLCGPSVGVFTGSHNERVFKGKKGLVPVQHTETLHFLSISSMIPKDSAVIWRAPKKIALLTLFLESMDETKYDYVVIDMPPGVTDEHTFVIERISEGKLLLVATAQNLALDETLSTLNLFSNNGISPFGIIENMRSIACPNCKEENMLFSKNGVRLFSEETGVPYLGAINFLSSLEEDVPDPIRKAVEYIEND
ncbi:hypothetical protein NEFER03_0473 [Nematocida sp. LUAm3]|nr:hypothetical protein NEFER03_0473 [Nematocida sp. LUAm3]KAI5175930.1 hypothetical protein NEFER02_1790 [Nematocida sp. LUAm2]KAI5178688.1 hypothetical protein NEFER01_1807 [Nematocida sp. LUAm1]